MPAASAGPPGLHCRGDLIRPRVRVNPWMYLALAIVCEVLATSALKSSEGFSRLWPTALVVTGYCSSFFFLSLCLRSIPVGVAYAIWSGVGVVLITGIGWWWFGQKLDAAALLGMGLIALGVLIIYLFSKSAEHGGG